MRVHVRENVEIVFLTRNKRKIENWPQANQRYYYIISQLQVFAISEKNVLKKTFLVFLVFLFNFPGKIKSFLIINF